MKRPTRGGPRLPRSLASDRGGVAGTEAALAVALVLIPLFLVVVDYGAQVVDQARLDRALQAAVFYVWSNTAGFTSSGIQTAADAGFGSASPTPTIASSTACKCVSSGYNPVSTVSCSGSCPSGQTVASYVTITATASFTLPVAIVYLTSPLSLSVSGTVRTQ